MVKYIQYVRNNRYLYKIGEGSRALENRIRTQNYSRLCISIDDDDDDDQGRTQDFGSGGGG